MTPTDPLHARVAALTKEFAFFDGWMDRYEYLIELGRELAPYPDELRDDAHRVRGCQARVWLAASLNDEGRLHLQADSDALITKGLVALLVRLLDGLPPHAAAQADFGFLDDLGLSEHLTAARRNGLQAMTRRLRAHALDLSQTVA